MRRVMVDGVSLVWSVPLVAIRLPLLGFRRHGVLFGIYFGTTPQGIIFRRRFEARFAIKL